MLAMHKMSLDDFLILFDGGCYGAPSSAYSEISL